MTRKDSLEKRLESLGEGLREEARERRPDYMASFRHRLAELPADGRSGTGFWESIIQWRVMAATGAAVAAIILAVLVSMHPGDTLGIVAYESGGVMITGNNADRGELARGSTLSITDRGAALASLDNDRVMVYMANGTRLGVAGRSNVSLESGTAWFAVRPNSGRFTVELPEGTVTVHGTAFGVHLNGSTSTVFLASGSVSLETAGERLTLVPNELAEMSFGGIPKKTMVGENGTPDWVNRLYTGFQLAYNSAYFPSSLPSTKQPSSENRTGSP
ncbi:MAG: FecR domain-containing protein [Candidatus Sumerlaeia bacterium]|nr:FecR domain-containing protein [Candidatus Sumerlaeia bacterium]